jgi:hypothetical protein
MQNCNIGDASWQYPKEGSVPEQLFGVLRGRIWGPAPRWGAKGALSGEAGFDRVGEDDDVSKVAGRSGATEGFFTKGRRRQ